MGGTNYYKSWSADEKKAYKAKYGTPQMFNITNFERFGGVPQYLSNTANAFDTTWQQQQHPKQFQPTQQQQADYARAISNAQNAASIGQQNAQQQIAGYNQSQQKREMPAPTQLAPALPSPAKGAMQANPLGAKAAAAASANQIGAGSNQFTLPATSGIKFGGT